MKSVMFISNVGEELGSYIKRNFNKCKNSTNVRANDDNKDARNHPAAALTVEADGADVDQQLLAVDVGHARAQAGVSGTELAVHVVQSVRHGVHGVHHKLNLPLLLVGGVTANFLQPWNRNREVVR